MRILLTGQEMMISKEDLKQEIEQLDEKYLELVFRLLQQFPRQQKIKPTIDVLSCSRPIQYNTTENGNGGQAFTDIEDAAAYGKQLRTLAWQRTRHDV